MKSKEKNKITTDQDILDYLKNNILIRVDSSDLHGVGIFAIRDLKKDTKIEQAKIHGTPGWEGSYNVSKDYLKENLPKSTYEYIRMWSGDIEGRNIMTLILPTLMTGQTSMYVNHSDEPNAIYHNLEMTLLKDVEKGEEITIDYGDYEYETS